MLKWQQNLTKKLSVGVAKINIWNPKNSLIKILETTSIKDIGSLGAIYCPWVL